jgi:hypothetical protein
MIVFMFVNMKNRWVIKIVCNRNLGELQMNGELNQLDYISLRWVLNHEEVLKKNMVSLRAYRADQERTS